MKTQDLWGIDLDAKWTPGRQSRWFGLHSDSVFEAIQRTTFGLPLPEHVLTAKLGPWPNSLDFYRLDRLG